MGDEKVRRMMMVHCHETAAPHPALGGSEIPFSLYATNGYDARMALARILVDGYSL